jgi:hypothetical protein
VKKKFNVNLKDITKDLSLSKSKVVIKDDNGYFRGKLEKIELVEVDYNEQVDINSERLVDEGRKIQLRFNFLLYTDDPNAQVSKNILVGTNLNKEPVSSKYKTRGNKKMKNVFNKFTELCLRLGFMSTDEFKVFDENLNNKIQKILETYNERNDDEKILIAARFMEDKEKIVINPFEIIKVDTIDYAENIANKMENFHMSVNRGLEK